MNAYELADINDWSCCAHVKEVSAMLRQQADRIRNLEKTLGFKNSGYETINLTPQIKELSDRELVVFLMDEIDRASEWLVDGETHMAIGVLGQCHAKIRKHLSNTKESE